MSKIKPTKTVKKLEKYNCSGKLRVKPDIEEGDLTELILLPKRGGCKILLQLIARLITGMKECNIDTDYILQILEDTDPCTAPKERADYKKGNIPKEQLGFGGCPKIIKWAIEQKLAEVKKKVT